MECTTCNDKIVDSTGNGDRCKMCDKSNEPSGSAVTVVNDVIFYIFSKGKSSPWESVRDGCITHYGEIEINDARKYLQDIMFVKLNMTEDDTAIDIGKIRRKSGNVLQ